HARRKFSDSIPKDITNTTGTLAQTGLKKIAALFKIEKDIEKMSAEDKVKVRQEKAKPLLDDFFLWCEKHKGEVLSKSKIHTAFQYALNHRKGLSEYLKDGYLPMTNSLDERTIRMFTVGRKNWLFSTSVKGAESSAAAYSIIETAKANGLDPYKYLTAIFSFLPSQDLVKESEAIDKFLPWSNQMQEMCKK
ncbi:MAG: transposase, partial [Longicatena sp.]